MLAAVFAGLTALGARIAFHVPFTPVPVTLQVFFVLLSGAVLGSRLGALSQVQYLALGAAGLPVFAGAPGGIAAFAGPTAGYLIGFVAAAWVVGRVVEWQPKLSFIGCVAAMAAGLAGIYGPGAAWLSLWLAATGTPAAEALSRAVLLGVVPFAGVDLVKAALAAGIALRLTRHGA